MKRVPHYLIFLFLFTMLSCNKFVSAPPISSKPASTVLSNNCVYCHMDYGSYGDRDFIEKGLVDPGLPQSSLLYVTLKGANEAAHETMPPEGKLSQSEREELSNWIKSLTYKEKRPSLKEFTIESTDSLSEAEVLARCYGQWTRKRLKKSNYLYSKVSKNEMTGSEACKALLASSFLNNKGISKEGDGREVLKTFQAFHRSWYSELNLYDNDEQWGNFEVYDPGNLGAFFTKNLLTPGNPISKVFRGKTSVELVRKSKVRRDFFIFPYQESSSQPLKVRDFYFGSGEEVKDDVYPVWKIDPVKTGELIGVRDFPRDRDVVPRVVDTRKGQRIPKGQKEYIVNKDIRYGQGGGILGSELYLLLNLKMEIGEPSDGGKKVPRKWSSSVVNNFLCRDLPVISLKQSNSFLREDSPISFRKKGSCVQCHATMDGMAGVIRNLEINYSVDSGLGKYKQTTHIRKNNFHKEAMRSKFILGDGSKDFYKEAARGAFVYESIDKVYYKKEIKSLEELGIILTKIPDFYRCMAKRYMYFLTGIKVDYEQGGYANSRGAYLVALNKKLARNLQRHQSLHQLIGEIVETSLYRDRYYLKQTIVKDKK